MIDEELAREVTSIKTELSLVTWSIGDLKEKLEHFLNNDFHELGDKVYNLENTVNSIRGELKVARPLFIALIGFLGAIVGVGVDCLIRILI